MLTFSVLINICIAIIEWGSVPFNTSTDYMRSLFIMPDNWKKNSENTLSPTNIYDMWFIYIISF